MAREKYIITPEIDKEIEDLYLNKVNMDKKRFPRPVADLAKKINFPANKITRRAQVLGLIKQGTNQSRWSQDEIKILESNYDKSLIVVKRKLNRSGYKRSITAIINKYRKMKIRRINEGYTAYSLSQCFGVCQRTILALIHKNKLTVKRRETRRTKNQGGDSFLISDSAVKQYIVNYVDEIDFRKIDKFWLVSILTNKTIK